MKTIRQKSQSINILDTKNFKEALLKIISPGIKEEYELYIEDLVKDITKQYKIQSSEKDKNKKEEGDKPLIHVNLNIVQYILNKRKRTDNDLLIIKCFLLEMNFMSLLKIKVGKDKLLFSLGKYLKIEKKPQNSLLFRYGNKGTKFYIVFSGELSVLILKDTKAKISYMRYFMHLLILKLLKEDDLLYKIISSNYGANQIDKNEFDYYYDNINKFINKYFGKFSNKNRYFIFPDNNNNNEIKRKKTATSFVSSKQYEEMLEDLDVVLDSEISSDEEEEVEKEEKIKTKIHEKNILPNDYWLRKRENSIKKIKRKEVLKNKQYLLKIYNINKDLNYTELPISQIEQKKVKLIVIYFIFCREVILSKKQFLSVNDYITYTYLNSPIHHSIKCESHIAENQEFNLFQYYEITKKKRGDTFGELALQHDDNQRTGTVMTLSDTVLGYLTKNDYEMSLSDIELRKRKKDVNFIMSFSIFSQMNWFVFENKYFNFFKKEKFVQGEKIMTQGQKNQKLFFIMDGQFEISTTVTLKKIFYILKLKMGDNFDIKQRPKDYKNYNFRLYISSNKDLLGLSDCYFYDDISFIDATCISLNSTVLTLDISILNELRQKIPEIEADLKKMIDQKQSIMIDRLKIIYNKIFQSVKILKEQRNILSAMNNNVNDNEEIKQTIAYNRQNDKKLRIKSLSPPNRPKTTTNINKNLNYNKEILPNIYSNTEGKSIEEQNLNSINNNNSINIYNKIMTNDLLFSNSYKNIKDNFNLTLIPKKDNEIIKRNKDFQNEETKKEMINQILQGKSEEIHKNEKFILKISKELNRVSNKHTKKKLIELYSPINKIIDKEYSNLFNWIDTSNNIKQTLRMKMRSNTEKKSIEPDYINIKGENILAKTFSYKRQISKGINIKRVLKINNGTKIKRKKKFIEESFDKILNESLNKDKKKYRLNLKDEKHSKTNTKQNSFKNDLDYREQRLKRLFSKYLKTTSPIENKPRKKILNLKKDQIKYNVISNIEQNNIFTFPNQKINFFLCSKNTKKNYGFEPPRIYIVNNTLSNFYNSLQNRNERFNLK